MVIEDYPRTLLELERQFATEEQCRAYLTRLRWPHGFICPRCGGQKGWPARGGRLVCASCQHPTTVTAGTVLQDSHLPLRLWLRAMWYHHAVSKLQGQPVNAATELLPRVHRVAALLKRWLLGTHQGAIAPTQLDYYLDEFTFRFNRRTSASRGKLFYRLAQQAVQVSPVPYKVLVGGANNPKHHP